MGLRPVGSFVCVSGIPICTSAFQLSCRPSTKSSRMVEVSVLLSAGLPTFLTAPEAKPGLTLVLPDRVDPELL